MGEPRTSGWSDAELSQAVEAYVFMLRLELVGLTISEKALADALLSAGLGSRSQASIRYRMRNISAVVQELGGPILNRYSPANQVGNNVRQVIRELLMRHRSFAALLQPTTPLAPAETRREIAREQLKLLRQHLDELEVQLLGMGHNHPPEPLATDTFTREDFRSARRDVEMLEKALEAPQRPVDLTAPTQGLLRFGLKAALWAGQRATKLTDATLAILAPVIAIKMAGLGPLVIKAITSVAAALG